MPPVEAIETFVENYNIQKPPENLDHIEEGFEQLREGIDEGEVIPSVIGDWIFNNVASKSVRVRKTSARVFEDFIEEMFEGEVLDKKSRDLGMPSKPSEKEGDFVEKWIRRNELQKEDVKFPNIDLSVKTLTPTNRELNMGSFAKEALFYEIWEEYGSERTGGLGSGTQMSKTFNQIQEDDKWEEFKERFERMIRGIYTDDLLIAIKNHDTLDVYLIESKEFQDLAIEYLNKGPDECTDFIYRFEAHALRYNMGPIKERFDPIEIPLNGDGSRSVETAKEIRNKFYQIMLTGMAGVEREEKIEELEGITEVAKKAMNNEINYSDTAKANLSDFMSS